MKKRSVEKEEVENAERQRTAQEQNVGGQKQNVGGVGEKNDPHGRCDKGALL
jgi:hypothetical protein